MPPDNVSTPRRRSWRAQARWESINQRSLRSWTAISLSDLSPMSGCSTSLALTAAKAPLVMRNGNHRCMSQLLPVLIGDFRLSDTNAASLTSARCCACVSSPARVFSIAAQAGILEHCGTIADIDQASAGCGTRRESPCCALKCSSARMLLSPHAVQATWPAGFYRILAARFAHRRPRSSVDSTWCRSPVASCWRGGDRAAAPAGSLVIRADECRGGSHASTERSSRGRCAGEVVQAVQSLGRLAMLDSASLAPA